MMLVEIVLSWFIVYTVVAFSIDRYYKSKDKEPPGWFSISGPSLFLKTEKGKNIIDKIAQSRIWNPLGYIGVTVFTILSLLGFLMVLVSSYVIIKNPSTESTINNPKNMLVIPGVNEFLPLSAASALITSLLIAIVAHELGHAIYCRVNDIEIESMGFFFLFMIPMGAFVKPDEDSQSEANPKGVLQMVCAGVMVNLILTIVVFALLVGPVAGAISPVSGAGVDYTIKDSPADKASISSGDVIVSIDNNTINNKSEALNVLDSDKKTHKIVTEEGKETEITKEAFIYSTYTNISDSKIESVNGIESPTKQEVLEEARSSETIVVTSNNTEYTINTGARVTTQEESLTIVSVNDKEVGSSEDLEDLLNEYNNQEVTVEFNDGTTKNYTVEDSSIEELSVVEGVNGTVILDVGIVFYNSEEYAGYLGNEKYSEGVSTLERLGIVVYLPLEALGSSLGFTGFSGPIYDFFEYDSIFFLPEGFTPVIASILFWSYFINLNLAVFNAIPTFALDGGHMVKNYSKLLNLDKKLKRKLSFSIPKIGNIEYEFTRVGDALVLSIQSIILIMLLVIVFIPYLF